MELKTEIIKSLPKVELHCHLDGGLRPSTILEIAKERKIELPESDPTKLGEWFHRGANRGNLGLYLEGFKYTIDVMQTKDELERVAFEAIEDAYADNIVYLELRFAPVFHKQLGLNYEQIVDSVLRGLERGKKQYKVEYGLIICAMRHLESEVSEEMAELAVYFRDRGVVGFDLAGDESGHPARHHIKAFQFIQQQNFYITIHAGEAFGPQSIWQAIQLCGAQRLGHGTRLVDDMAVVNQKVVKHGTLSQYVLDRRIPIEICLSSNVQTGAVESLQKHPFPIFFHEKFRVTLSTDNTLMSDTTMTKEFKIAVDTYHLTLSDLEKITLNSIKSAFISYDKRCKIIYETIKPQYAKIRQELGL